MSTERVIQLGLMFFTVFVALITISIGGDFNATYGNIFVLGLSFVTFICVMINENRLVLRLLWAGIFIFNFISFMLGISAMIMKSMH